MGAEFPFMFAGIVTLAGGAIKEGGWPKDMSKGVIGIVVLILVASATNDTKGAPLMRAFGWLVLLVATMATVKAVNERKRNG